MSKTNKEEDKRQYFDNPNMCERPNRGCYLCDRYYILKIKKYASQFVATKLTKQLTGRIGVNK